jgi:SNF2 family DNA or RNA helicase
MKSLKPFQEVGVNFLIKNKCCLLGDDVGLGKTIQTITAIKRLNLKNVLVLCPKSVKEQWKKEFSEWAPELKVLIIEGTKTERLKLWQQPAEVKIANYELLRVNEDFNFLTSIFWDCVVADEITRIKSYKAKITKLITKLKAYRKIGLTGTIIENYPVELFNIFRFINPYVFGFWYNFKNNFLITKPEFYYGKKIEKIIGYKNLDFLKLKIKPFLLRRKREEVLNELPPIQVLERTFNLTPFQQKIYEVIKSHAIDLINKDITAIGDFQLLRILCDTPLALKNSNSWVRDFITDDKINSEKFDEVLAILNEIGNKKVVIFTEWYEVLAILKNFLETNNYKVLAYYGELSEQERTAIEQKFLNSRDYNILISTQAGGYGVNWQKASVMINFDSPFNPAKLYQRVGRIYRMGQTNSVVIFDFYTKNTVEEKVRDILNLKLSLIDKILELSTKKITLDNVLIAKLI